MCPVCSQKFFITYGLSCHLEAVHGSKSKSSLTFSCFSCKTQFRGLERFVDHLSHVHHQNNVTVDTLCNDNTQADDRSGSLDVAKKSTTLGKGTAFAPGFYASLSDILPVVDFSSEKFSLVTQLLSERSPVRKVQKSGTHSIPPRSTVGSYDSKKQIFSCTNCDQSFCSRAQCSEHVLQCHDTAVVMAEFSKNSIESDPRKDNISQEEYALVLGLKISENRNVACDVGSPAGSSANKCTVVDANRNVVRADIQSQSVVNGQATRVLFGRLLTLPGAMPQILQGSVPGVLSLPQPLLIPSKSMHQAFGLSSSGALDQSVLVARAGLQPLSGIVTPAVSVIPASSMSAVLLNTSDETGASELTNTSLMNFSPTAALENSPNDSDSLDMKADASDKDSTTNAGSYRCSVCDDTFISYRAYRGSVRHHMQNC
jgi:hypothetical protein